MQEIVREIIVKEEEKFQLRHAGAIADLPYLLSLVGDKISFDGDDSEFAGFKEKVLKLFYSEIGFENFILNQKQTQFQTPFFTTLYLNLKRKYNSKNKELTDLERDLEIIHVIAWYLTQNLFNKMRKTFSDSETSFYTAREVQAFFENECSKKFPLDFGGFMLQVEEHDDYFMNVIAEIVKNSAQIVTKRKKSVFDESLLLSALIEETYAFFINKLNEPEIKFETAAQLKTYIAKTCEIFFWKYCRDNKKELNNCAYIDEISGSGDTTECNDAKAVFDEYEIDLTNEYEIARAITVIILNKTHPLYQKLVQKDEKKVELLIEKGVNGLSYSEIVVKMYGDTMTKSEMRKKEIALRKEYERFRATLKTRIKNIMTK